MRLWMSGAGYCAVSLLLAVIALHTRQTSFDYWVDDVAFYPQR